eukprot:COSAG02_NODE_3731_length_6312_cov_32.691453_7_plen_108_part_00
MHAVSRRGRRGAPPAKSRAGRAALSSWYGTRSPVGKSELRMQLSVYNCMYICMSYHYSKYEFLGPDSAGFRGGEVQFQVPRDWVLTYAHETVEISFECLIVFYVREG